MPDFDEDTPVGETPLASIDRRVQAIQKTSAEAAKAASDCSIKLEQHIIHDQTELRLIRETLNDQDEKSQAQSQKLETIRDHQVKLAVDMGEIKGALGVLVKDSDANRKIAMEEVRSRAKIAVIREEANAAADLTEKNIELQRTKGSTTVSIKLIAMIGAAVAVIATALTKILG